jgi:ABC-type transport system involved in cytochrome c biogenesis ATPase subunit
MLTKLVIRNFKRFEDVEIPLGNPVVFVGPNNSGKTTALQALALWDLGLRRWREKRGSVSPEKRPGVTINRRDLLMVPSPNVNHLWRQLHVRNVQRIAGIQATKNILIDILVSGNTGGTNWECGLEFDLSTSEAFFCRPLRIEEGKQPRRMNIPDEVAGIQIAFLPPMSGLASNETRLDMGAINVRLGEGRTAEVLRNLCYALCQREWHAKEEGDADDGWTRLSADMLELFKVNLDQPEYIPERGEVQMTYRDENGIRLDLSSSGRGLQQTLLLLAYLALHPGAVLLLDEPDAHLEILRQREIYWKLREAARASGSQIIIASHSEEILNQAASLDENSVVAFLGKPHIMPGSRKRQVKSALNAIRFDEYYQAEQSGWVLYLEDHTDLSILRAFAARFGHPAEASLRTAFLYPIGNHPNKGREHFHNLREAKQDLVGFLLVDRDAHGLRSGDGLEEQQWVRREIENYICQPDTLVAFARAVGESKSGGPLLDYVVPAAEAMQGALQDRIAPAALRDPADPWWNTVKASDELLDLVIPEFYRRMGWYMETRKADYYRLVPHVPENLVADEIKVVLDRIEEVAAKAHPA